MLIHKQKGTLMSKLHKQQSIQLLCKKVENWWKESENKKNNGVPDG